MLEKQVPHTPWLLIVLSYHLQRLCGNPYESLNLYEELSEGALKLIVYANMRQDEDTTESKYQALLSRARSLYTQIGSVMSFYLPELLQISDEELSNFIVAEPQLKKYEHFLQDVSRQRPHVLSVEAENLIAQTGDMAQAAENVFSMLNN